MPQILPKSIQKTKQLQSNATRAFTKHTENSNNNPKQSINKNNSIK